MDLQSSLDNDGSFLNELDYDQDFSKGYSSYTWCELASCLKGFKVIPSSPHPSAFSYASIMVWSFINVTAISAILTIRKRVWDDGHGNQGDCEGLEILDWFLLAYDLCSFIQWWRAFGLVAGQPHYAPDISILAWFTPFRYAFSMHYCPYSCWFTERP
jgi:hypothetical protein